MNNRKVEDLLEAISEADLVQVDSHSFTGDITISKPTTEPSHEVILIKWYNEKGEGSQFSVCESALAAANFQDNELFLGDQEGSAIIVRLFNLFPIQIKKTWG